MRTQQPTSGTSAPILHPTPIHELERQLDAKRARLAELRETFVLIGPDGTTEPEHDPPAPTRLRAAEPQGAARPSELAA